MVRGAVLITAAVIALASLTACETLPPDMVFTYGARGVQIEAERFVADIYGLPADPLPYANGDIYYAIAGIKARWPSLKPLLEDGTVGLTDDGDVAIHDIGTREGGDLRQLHALVQAENRDRFFMYRGMTTAAGWSGEESGRMIYYTEDAFAKEWWKQAPKGWWLQDQKGRWQQK